MKSRLARFEGHLKIKPSAREEFVAWEQRYLEALSSFPGHVEGFEPRPTTLDLQWSVRLRFESPKLLGNWLSSDERATLLSDVESLTERSMVCRLSIGENPSVGVTEVIFAAVKPGCEKAYEKWQAELNRQQSTFPGYLGAALQPPLAGQDQWTTLLRFADEKSLKNWLSSDVRRSLLSQESQFVVGRTQQRLDSAFAGWLPEGPVGSQPPPDWKMSMLILLGLFPIVMLQLRFLNPVLADLPMSPGTFIANILSTLLITYLTLPLSIKVFGWWLFEKSPSSKLHDLKGVLVLSLLYVVELVAFWNLL